MGGIVKYTSWVTAYLLLCGCLKGYLYYKQFHVSILPFLDFTEILTLLMDNIFAYLLVGVAFTISCFLLYHRIIRNTRDLKAGSIFKLYFSEYKLLLTLIAISSLFLLWFYSNAEGVSMHQLLLLVLFLVCVVVIFPVISIWAKYFIQRYFSIILLFRYTVLFSLGALLFLYTFLIAYIEAGKVMNYGFYNGVLCRTEDKVIKSDSEYFYIGKTKEYVFFYDRNAERCDVYPADKIIMYSFIKE